MAVQQRVVKPSHGEQQPRRECRRGDEPEGGRWLGWSGPGRGRERRGRRVSEMTRSEVLPSAGALDEVRRLAGSSAVILDVARLEGGQHADTWRVDTDNPAFSAVVRQFPTADSAAGH